MKKVLYISGMHCPSCDLLIRESLWELNDIEITELTEAGVLTYVSSQETSDQKVKESIISCGYTVSDTISSSSSFDWKEAVILACIGFLIRRLLTTLDLTWYVASLWTNGVLWYGEMFILWFIASLSTCLALVGWFVIMRGSLQWWTRESFMDAFRHQWLFQIGRLWWYALWWAALWFLWSAIIFSPSVNASINLIVSILLLVMWWNMLWRITISLPTRWWGDRLMSVLRNFSKKKWGGVIVGALTFLLPCWFTQVAQINAMSTWSPTQWALLLFVFALGTLPVLLTLWLTWNRFQSHQAWRWYKILWVALIVLSVFLIQSSTRLLGWL